MCEGSEGENEVILLTQLDPIVLGWCWSCGAVWWINQWWFYWPPGHNWVSALWDNVWEPGWGWVKWVHEPDLSLLLGGRPSLHHREQQTDAGSIIFTNTWMERREGMVELIHKTELNIIHNDKSLRPENVPVLKIVDIRQQWLRCERDVIDWYHKKLFCLPIQNARPSVTWSMADNLPLNYSRRVR